MPLSTVLGAQSLVQPAVCTTATRPASPFTGQAIYDTTVLQVLVYNGTAFAPVSKVLQVISAEYSTSTSTSSTSYVTTNLTATITPSSASSKIVVFASLPIQCPASQNTHVTLFRGTVAGTNLAGGNGFALVSAGTVILNESVAISYSDSPSTTSAQAYTVGMKVSGGTATAFLSTTTGGITLMEISA